jgi:hypothetical protein
MPMLRKIRLSLEGVWLSIVLTVQFLQYLFASNGCTVGGISSDRRTVLAGLAGPSDRELDAIEAEECALDPVLDAPDLTDFWVGCAIDSLSQTTQGFLRQTCTVQVFQSKDSFPVVVLFAKSETDFDEANGAHDIQRIAARFYATAHVELLFVVEPQRILKVVSTGEGCDIYSAVQMPREAS